LRLADRVVDAEASPSHAAAPPSPSAEPPPAPAPPASLFSSIRPSLAAAADPDTDAISLRALLATAQQARATLEAELAALPAFKQSHAQQTRALEARARDAAVLQRKVRDRESEVREGRKLVESVQDEMVSLNLQLNMAEQKAERLEAENRELVRRWMEKMGEEADRMNEESKW
jgi:hypothetical protein